MKNIAICATIAAALGLANTVQAEEYWASANVGGTTSGNTNPFAGSCLNIWTNAQGETAAELGVENFAGTDILHVQNGYTLTLGASSTFTGAFHAGATDGSSSATLNPRSDTLTLDNLLWHSATLTMNRSSRFPILAGNAALDCPNATHKIGAMSSSLCGICLASNLSCSDDDLSVTIETTVSGTGDRCIVISGNNAGYEGNFKQLTAQTPLVVAHANALGNPSVGKSDALSIDAANAVFSVVKGVALNSARGIDINKDGFRICATNYSGFHSGANSYKDCTEFELAMPITGSYGFTKDGDGTVTLSGNYMAGDIVVTNGTLVMASTASFPRGQKATVCAGATLVQNVFIPAIDVDCKEGGTYTKGYSYSVPYNPDTGVSTPFDFTDGIPGDDEVLPISLSAAIKLPFYSTNRIDMAMLPSDTTATAAAFADLTPKTYGLPKTSFEIEERDGTNYLVLVATPVVVSVANFTNAGNDSLNTSSGSWSDSDVAKPGYDYLVTNQIARIPATSFSGDSLTIANAAESGNPMNLYTRADGSLDATIYAGTCDVLIVQNDKGSGGNYTVSGNICIAGEYDDSNYLRFQSKYCITSYTPEKDPNWASWGSYWHRLSANLSGEGPLMLHAPNSSTGEKGNPQLYGDNSAYKGKIYVTYSGSNKYLADGVGVALTFNSANALGGALDTFKYDSLTLDKYSTLRPATSIDFSTSNRGIYGSGPFGFDVQDGITFKVGVPVKMDDIMFKHGEGDLILGGEISYGSGSAKTCYVREGGIGALNDAAVAGLNMVFSNGTKIVVSSDASLVNGFTGVSFEPADATVSVSVANGYPARSNGHTFSVAIATVADGDLSNRFDAEQISGFNASIVRETVEIDGNSYYRYKAKYQSAAGTTIIMR